PRPAGRHRVRPERMRQRRQRPLWHPRDPQEYAGRPARGIADGDSYTDSGSLSYTAPPSSGHRPHNGRVHGARPLLAVECPGLVAIILRIVVLEHGLNLLVGLPGNIRRILVVDPNPPLLPRQFLLRGLAWSRASAHRP